MGGCADVYLVRLVQYCAIDFDDTMVHWFMMDITNAISDFLEQDGEEAGQKVAKASFFLFIQVAAPRTHPITSKTTVSSFRLADLYREDFKN